MPRAKYEISYLPVAENDLADIVAYIAVELAAPEAANRLLDKIGAAVERLGIFPFAHPVYHSNVDTRPFEFRVRVVDSYIVLYYVTDRTVTVARILYAGRDIGAILEKNDTRPL
ncbi:type II toxin-antitoxin system RelE/ParE family toxin [Synergistaceae bacterium OttesenSCG-928-I11]|nr:type II toxin-antitoxin system RelE/ParE family toxin [Synergistaceae bacterium OttesenSCG-928-I11]